jgi:putative FmdB family regulatory protein
MAVHEYKCKKCGEKFELRFGLFHTQKSIKCPKCGSTDSEKVVSPHTTDRSYGPGYITGHFG